MTVFQTALAAGAPWGKACYGGQHPGRLPGKLRITSAASVPAYVGGAVVLASHRTPARLRQVTAGALGVVGVAGTIVNALSPSPPERLWALWSVALTAATLPHAQFPDGSGGR